MLRFACSSLFVVVLAFAGLVRADVPVAHIDEARERVLENQLNQARETAGLPPLAHDDRLRELARYHSADMAMAGFSGPTSPVDGPLAPRAARTVGVAAARIRTSAVAGDSVDTALVDPRVTRVAIGVVDLGDRTFVTWIGVMDNAEAVQRAGLMGLLDRIWIAVASAQLAGVDGHSPTR